MNELDCVITLAVGDAAYLSLATTDLTVVLADVGDETHAATTETYARPLMLAVRHRPLPPALMSCH